MTSHYPHIHLKLFSHHKYKYFYITFHIYQLQRNYFLNIFYKHDKIKMSFLVTFQATESTVENVIEYNTKNVAKIKYFF